MRRPTRFVAVPSIWRLILAVAVSIGGYELNQSGARLNRDKRPPDKLASQQCNPESSQRNNLKYCSSSANLDIK